MELKINLDGKLTYDKVKELLDEYGYEPVIGLEIHIELNTKTKLFCSCKNEFGAEPNTNVCPVCLGLPGSLPVLNKEALRYFIRFALALGSHIAKYSKFDRKNYFYPDMPKNYQISQYDEPLARGGGLEVGFLRGVSKFIQLKRMHLEEDTGKSVHVGAKGLYGSQYTLLDFNRAGVPLIEIVTEPVLSSPDEVVEFLEFLRLTALTLGISDVKMEEGSLRCDANVSLRKKGSETLGTKTEIKNVNSFRFLHKALTYEIARQLSVILSGGQVKQETRGFDEKRGITFTMRSKEEVQDYRYFPEPDLLPLEVPDELISEEREKLPELPVEKAKRLKEEYSLSPDEIWLLLNQPELSDFFERSVKLGAKPKTAINWLKSDIHGKLERLGMRISETKLSPEIYVKFCNLIDSGTITSKIAKKIIPDLLEGKDPEVIIEERGLKPLEDEESLRKVIEEVLSENPKAVEDYRSGKKGVIGFLIGRVMKATKGKAHPQKTREILERLLSSDN